MPWKKCVYNGYIVSCGHVVTPEPTWWYHRNFELEQTRKKEV